MLIVGGVAGIADSCRARDPHRPRSLRLMVRTLVRRPLCLSARRWPPDGAGQAGRNSRQKAASSTSARCSVHGTSTTGASVGPPTPAARGVSRSPPIAPEPPRDVDEAEPPEAPTPNGTRRTARLPISPPRAARSARPRCARRRPAITGGLAGVAWSRPPRARRRSRRSPPPAAPGVLDRPPCRQGGAPGRPGRLRGLQCQAASSKASAK